MAAKPPRFTPELAPYGVEVRFVDFAASRPAMPAPTAIHVHTNGASGEGSLQSAWNWTHAAPGSNTLPHYQVDRTRNGVTPARKMLATNLRGIGSTTVGPATRNSAGNLIWPTLSQEQRDAITAHDNVRTHTIVIETADTGTIDDPTISAFDAGQLETVAEIIAYESITHGFPLVLQAEWWEPGVASHTDPAGFPFTTIHRGKICPGLKKKAQVRDVIIPRARQIVDLWTAPPPPVTPLEVPAGMWIIAKTDAGWLASPGIRKGAFKVTAQVPATFPFYNSGTDRVEAYNLATGRPVSGWALIPADEVIPEATALQYMGPRVSG
jgi:hypothetical protein